MATDRETTTARGYVASLGRQVRRSEALQALPFWGPPAAVVLLAVYGAIGWNIIISLTDFSGLVLPTYSLSTLDLEMYARVLDDPLFWNALVNTFTFMIVFTGLCLLVGLTLAILIDKQIRFEGLFRTVFLLPFSISVVVTAKLWLWMYNSQSGVINTLLESAGFGMLAVEWLGSGMKFLSVTLAMLWQMSGYVMVIYLAGLRRIPTSQYEAAKVDGAGILTTYRKVVFPRLGSTTLVAGIILILFSLGVFDFLFAMFGANPGPSVDLLATMMYRQAYENANWAYGAALANILFAITIAIVLPYTYYQYSRGNL